MNANLDPNKLPFTGLIRPDEVKELVTNSGVADGLKEVGGAVGEAVINVVSEILKSIN